MRKNLRLAAALSCTATALALIAPGVSAEGNPPRSPLSAWLGFGHDVAAEDQIFLEERQEREALIAQCMRSKGLDYVPRPSPKEFAVDGALTVLEFVDPNEARVRELPAADRDEYWLALIGQADPSSQTAELDTNGDHKVDYLEAFGGGCEGDAYRQLPGVFAAKAILTEEFLDLRMQARTDARVVAAESEWVSCMNKAGLDGGSRVEIFERREGVSEVDVRAFERALRRCEPSWMAVIESVQAELEAAFVDGHKEVLETFGVPRP